MLDSVIRVNKKNYPQTLRENLNTKGKFKQKLTKKFHEICYYNNFVSLKHINNTNLIVYGQYMASIKSIKFIYCLTKNYKFLVLLAS